MVNRGRNFNIYLSGRTALEMLGVLAVIGVIGAGFMQLANLAMRKNSSVQAILEIQDISDKVRALYSWKNNYRSPADMLDYLKGQEVLKVKSDGTPIPPTGTSISITGERLNSSGSTCSDSTANCQEVFTIKLTHLLGIDILIIGSKYLDYTTGKLTNTKTENSFSLNENDVNFLKEVYNKNIPSFEANYLKIITIIALFLQNQFDIKLNSIDLLNNY